MKISDEIRAAILADLAARRSAAAIKRYRTATGTSLLEAYRAIKTLAEEIPLYRMSLISAEERAAILHELGGHRRVVAIKMYRAATGASLLQSYHAVKILSADASAHEHGARDVLGAMIGWLFGALPLLYVVTTSLRELPLLMKVLAVAVGATLGFALRRLTATRIAG